MSNRYFNQFQLTLEKQMVSIFAKVAFGAAGAPTLSKNKGIVSMVRNSAGLYTVTFGLNATTLDTYNSFFGHQYGWDSNVLTLPPISPLITVENVLTATASTLQLHFWSPSGVTQDPDNGDAVYLEFKFKNTSVA